jgi:hypothetical protein
LWNISDVLPSSFSSLSSTVCIISYLL